MKVTREWVALSRRVGRVMNTSVVASLGRLDREKFAADVHQAKSFEALAPAHREPVLRAEAELLVRGAGARGGGPAAMARVP